NRVDVIAPQAEITADYGPGEVVEVPQQDGSLLRLRKLDADYDATDRVAALNHLQAHQARGELPTGLLFVDPDAGDLHAHVGTVTAPLNTLGEAELCPGREALDAINAALR